jgi:AcrR family transcriptional regulator
MVRGMVGGSETLSPASYFEVAMELLAEDGPRALTVSGLCSRLGVTKGSFYHHFDGRPQFVGELVEFWTDRQSSRLIEVSRSVQEAHERIAVLKRLAVNLPHEAEAAIRAWSSQDAAVAAAQSRVDRLRHDHLKVACGEAGVPEDRAELLATLAISVLAGMQMIVRPADPSLVGRVFDELEAAFLPPTVRSARRCVAGEEVADPVAGFVLVRRAGPFPDQLR